jgi:hypothetical protein
MAGGKSPAPYCSYSNPEDVEDGTLCRASSPPPGSLGVTTGQATSRAPTPVVSPALRITLEVPFSIAPQMTWDAFQRLAYDKLNAGLQQQANELLKRGSISYQEMEKLVNARNASVLQVRNRLTSFGELYSEMLKPRASLKTAEQLLSEKGSIEAVLESVGKTRQVVDRIGIVSRFAGPAAIVLEISIVTVVIAQASPQDRGRVAARQIGGAVGGLAGGSGGMWLGCVSGAALASWSLVVPIVGEGATGGACLIGGLIGGLGIGFGGRMAGESLGEGAYDFVTSLHWVR